MSKKPPVQTPGAEAGFEDESETAGPVEEPADSGPAGGLPPDLQSLVAKAVAAEMAKLKVKPGKKQENLPTQAEALAIVKADPKHRSVLSVDGWVTAAAAVKERDGDGFAKA